MAALAGGERREVARLPSRATTSGVRPVFEHHTEQLCHQLRQTKPSRGRLPCHDVLPNSAVRRGTVGWRARGREDARKHSRSLAPAVKPSYAHHAWPLVPSFHVILLFPTAHFWRAIRPLVGLRLSGTSVMHCPQTSRLCRDSRLGTLDPAAITSPRLGRACGSLKPSNPARKIVLWAVPAGMGSDRHARYLEAARSSS